MLSTSFKTAYCRWFLGLTCLLCVAVTRPVHAEPESGDVFREYRWTSAEDDAGGALRVGGRLDYGGDAIPWGCEVDLEHATRAEIVIEKLLCHDRTRGLSISVNDHEWMLVPESDGIPEPQWEYQHHFYPVIDVPLDQLEAGPDNQFRMKIDPESQNWPQNLIYGVHLRVYYDARRKPHPIGRIVAPGGEAPLGESVTITIDALPGAVPVQRIDYLGLFEDVNLEGDGHYRRWHYHYRRGKLAGHIGTASAAPWSITWDTAWVPDQKEPMALVAWITNTAGLTFVTDEVTGLRLDRKDRSIELCKPYDIPRRWLTRRSELAEKFRIEGDLSKAIAAKLVWVSWSPGYLEGVFVNDYEVLKREGPRYAYFAHDLLLEDLSILKPGENVLKTGHTPKYNGKMVHGAEINWPGIMVLIQYRR